MEFVFAAFEPVAKISPEEDALPTPLALDLHQLAKFRMLQLQWVLLYPCPNFLFETGLMDACLTWTASAAHDQFGAAARARATSIVAQSAWRRRILWGGLDPWASLDCSHFNNINSFIFRSIYAPRSSPHPSQCRTLIWHSKAMMGLVRSDKNQTEEGKPDLFIINFMAYQSMIKVGCGTSYAFGLMED